MSSTLRTRPALAQAGPPAAVAVTVSLPLQRSVARELREGTIDRLRTVRGSRDRR